MSKKKDQVVQTSKEIIVKFIEMGKVSPTTFDKVFKNVYKSVKETLLDDLE